MTNTRGIKTMYAYYINRVNSMIDKCTTDIESLELSMAHYRVKLFEHKDYLNEFCNVVHRDIVNRKNVTTKIKILGSDKVLNKILLVYINGYFKAVAMSKKLIADKAQYKKYIITKDVYRALICLLNNESIKLLITDQIPISFGNSGNLYIKCIDRKNSDKAKNLPDWGTSNKNKAAILERGGIPFKSIKDKDGKIIGDNGGESWLAYHSSSRSWSIRWSAKFIPNRIAFEFRPSEYNMSGYNIDNIKDSVTEQELFNLNIGLVHKLNYYHVLNPIAYLKYI